MIVRVEVKDGNGQPVGRFQPGTAFVYLNDALIAKLRTGEGITVETTEKVATTDFSVPLPSESEER